MKKLLLLTMMSCLSLCTMAKDEYPNALMVRLDNGSTIGFLLENTTLQLLPSSNQVKVSTLEDNQTFTLSDVKGIAYEYHDSGTLDMKTISMKSVADIEVYNLEGHRVCAVHTSLGNALKGLSKGIYIIKVNGKILKIAK